jgi:hypothetical protein
VAVNKPAIIVIGEVVGDSKKEQVLWRIKIKSQYSTSVWKGMNCIQYFFKMHQVNMLIVGGNVGLEKLSFC